MLHIIAVSAAVVLLARPGAGAACDAANTTAIGACGTAFTACSADTENSKCTCLEQRNTCAIAVDCDAANTQGHSFFKACKDESCGNCDDSNVQKACDADLDAAKERQRVCLDGAFADKTACDCATAHETFLKANEATCGADYTNELTVVGFTKPQACSAEGLAGCSPYQLKQISNASDTYDACERTTRTGSVTNIGKLCTCVVDVEAALKAVTKKCLTLDFLKTSISTTSQLYSCNVNAGKTLTCDDDKVSACSTGFSQCTTNAVTGAVGVVKLCPCYSAYSQCIGNNANCPVAIVTQRSFYEVCKTTCPATTNCGPMGTDFMFTFDTTTAAPEVEPVTDANGATVTDTNGAVVTRTVPRTTFADGTDGTDGTGDVDVDIDIDGIKCSTFQKLKVLACVPKSCLSIDAVVKQNATACGCRQDVFNCVASSGCEIPKVTKAQTDECLKQCPGLAACSGSSGVAQLVLSVLAGMVAIAIRFF